MQQPPPPHSTSNTGGINYREVYYAATHSANTQEMLSQLSQMREHLRHKAHQAGTAQSDASHALAARRAEALAQHQHQPSLRDTHVGTLLKTYHLYANSVGVADTLSRKITHLRGGVYSDTAVKEQADFATSLWEQLADHQVFLLPWYSSFSTLDLAHLTEGTLTQQRGLLGIQLPDYAEMWPDWDGWHIRMDIDGTMIDVPLETESAHHLVTHALHVQDAPFSNECVLPSASPHVPPTFNGMTMVLPVGSMITTREARDDNQIEIDERPLRVSLYREHYAALVWSVAAHRYPETAHEHAYYNRVTGQCFGGDTNHIPQNLTEVEFWSTNVWLARVPEEEQAQYFQAGYGYLSDYQPEDLCDLARFSRVYTRLKQEQYQPVTQLRHEVDTRRAALAKQRVYDDDDDGEEEDDCPF